MTPSLPQLPPFAPSVSQRFRGGPPAASILFSLSSVKNPRWRESGDQKGYWAPSVPGSARAAGSSRARTKS